MDLLLRTGRRRRRPTSPSPTTRTPTGARWRSRPAAGLADAARRRGGRPARRPPDAARRAGLLRHHDRLLVDAAGAVRGPRASTTRETLTGFKWIVRAGDPDRLVYGYEEALGYCVAPEHVRDKDGITAALLVAELAAGLKAELRTLGDRLDDLAARVRRVRHRPALGTGGRPLRDRRDDGPAAGQAAHVAAGRAGHRLGGPAAGRRRGHRPDRIRPGWWSGPPAPSRSSRRTWRYVEPVADGDVAAARERATAALAALRAEVAAALGL